MPVQPILQLGNPKLRQTAEPIVDARAPEVASLIKDLSDTLTHWRTRTGYGRAIAAPQIGAGVRAVLLHLPGSDPWPLLNPEIVKRSEETHVVWDLCLSFLSLAVQVERHVEVVVRYEDTEGCAHQIKAGLERDLGELLQHEIDHLDGILTVDRIYDIKTLCTLEEFERRFRVHSPYAAHEGV